MALRFTLVDEAVVLARVNGSQARRLSAKLTEGKKIEIGFTITITIILAIIFSGILSWLFYLPLTIIGQEGNFLWDVINECSISIIFSIMYIVLFLFYWERKNNLVNLD